MNKRNNKYEQVVDSELDLHGYTSEEAKTAIREFILSAAENNYTKIRIIVGKGNRSQNGSILGPVIKNWLADNNYSYSPAKLKDGGEGALVVTI